MYLVKRAAVPLATTGHASHVVLRIRGFSSSQADVVVCDGVPPLCEPRAHPWEELALGLVLAGELDKGGLEGVERQVDVEVAVVVVARGLSEPVGGDVARRVGVGQQEHADAPSRGAALDGARGALLDRVFAARVRLHLVELRQRHRLI
eukprot:6180881-Pleurochrysis_carterae.AAC.2